MMGGSEDELFETLLKIHGGLHQLTYSTVIVNTSMLSY